MMFGSEVFDRYYNLSLRYLSYRPRSEKEVKDYLHKKQLRTKSLTDEIIIEIIKKLESYNFINDDAFAKAWISERRRIKNKPTQVIRFELKQKGIKEEIIKKYLDKDSAKDSDLESAKKLAEKKMDFYRNLPEVKRREKVMGYLLRKGFSWDITKKALID